MKPFYLQSGLGIFVVYKPSVCLQVCMCVITCTGKQAASKEARPAPYVTGFPESREDWSCLFTGRHKSFTKHVTWCGPRPRRALSPTRLALGRPPAQPAQPGARTRRQPISTGSNRQATYRAPLDQPLRPQAPLHLALQVDGGPRGPHPPPRCSLGGTGGWARGLGREQGGEVKGEVRGEGEEMRIVMMRRQERRRGDEQQEGNEE